MNSTPCSTSTETVSTVSTRPEASSPETDVSGNDPIVTGKIALAHLTEFPDYYTRLAVLEREAADHKRALTWQEIIGSRDCLSPSPHLVAGRISNEGWDSKHGMASRRADGATTASRGAVAAACVCPDRGAVGDDGPS